VELGGLDNLENIQVEAKNTDIFKSLVELDSQHLTNPVNAYIRFKLKKFEIERDYDKTVVEAISTEVHQRANNTFLWVALAFKSLEDADIIGEQALDHIKEIPAGLLELYGHMIARIETRTIADVQACKKVLITTSLAYRPLSIPELAALTGLSPSMTDKAVKICNSFLSTEERTVKLIHQTAREYLTLREFELDGKPAHGHMLMARYAINSLSKLKRNICGLEEYGFKPMNEGDDVDYENNDDHPLAPMKYSSVFWADHVLSLVHTSKYKAEQIELIEGELFRFLYEHILHWLESLSLMGKLSNGPKSIRILLHIAKVGHGAVTSVPPLNPVSLI
jgi:hypothetical protein